MRVNAWVALAVAFGIIVLSVAIHSMFITLTTPDGEVIEGNLFNLEEGTNITITGSDATNTITISATGSAAVGIDVQENGTTTVTGAGTVNFNSPFSVTDSAGTADIDLPLADDSVFIGNTSGVPVATAWPDCDLNFQATTYSTGSNAIGCQFVPTSWQLIDPLGTSPWTLPGYGCGSISTSFGPTQNDIIYGLIIPPQTSTYTAIGINVTSAGGGGTVARLGIYEDDQTATGVTPGALIVDAGTVSIASTGVKSIAISETLEAGKPYFLAIAHDAAAVSLTACNPEFWRASPVTNRAVTPGTSLNGGSLIASGVGVGAFADPATAPDTLFGDELNTAVKLSE